MEWIDARTLHTKMQVRIDFSDWVKAQIKKFSLNEDEDYYKVIQHVNSRSNPRIDYSFTKEAVNLIQATKLRNYTPKESKI